MEDPTAHCVWDTALGQLQLQVTRPNFDTWLKDTVGLRTENGSFIIGTPSDFVSEWLSAKMGPVIAKTVSAILGRSVTLRFQVVAPQGNGNGNGHGADLPPLDGAPSIAAVISSPRPPPPPWRPPPPPPPPINPAPSTTRSLSTAGPASARPTSSRRSPSASC